jgi:hypothetical protein
MTTGGAVAQDPGFDATKAHRHFSADCFNKAWELIERTDRTSAEDEQMIRLSHASLARRGWRALTDGTV